jgi:DMSO/TMAO reductase YedYZ molybdopterin-dependent catalytic subunit
MAERALSRRQFLSATALLLAPAALPRAAQPEARFVTDVPLGSALPPFGRLLGTGLDARLFTDLSQLRNPQSLADPQSIRDPQSALRTANDFFFVRTAASPTLPPAETWTVRVGGLVSSPIDVRLRDLEPLAAPPARVLLECSGNADQTNYGLLSAADWEGIPLAAVLDRVKPSGRSARVLVSGVDDDTRAWRTSIAGASWIFTRDDLQRAVLAVRMNGAALPRDHGAPVRLIVPGWYGCTCIKWVDRIDLVADDVTATSQMREFAARTHQDAGARLAREFMPAVIDTAAMPIRVEKWIVSGRIEYRITGIIWGGSKPTGALSIRFKSGGEWRKVDNCPVPASTLTWSLWTHTWRPAEPGRYEIVLRVDDPSIRTRRLDLFFYVREVQIDDV